MRLGSVLPILFALAVLSACASTPQTPPPISTPPLAQTPPARFADEIAAFQAADAAQPPPACQTLFVGSSSIRRWTSLAQDFPNLPVLNRGFGGSTTAEANAYFDRIVAPYAPRAIVFYEGENDIDDGMTTDAVFAEFQHFLALKTAALGDTPVYFISVKPSILRWSQFAAQTALNARVRALADQRADLVYVDIVPAMLENGAPKPIFVADNLHMTTAGYALWTPIVAAALAAPAPTHAPHCS